MKSKHVVGVNLFLVYSRRLGDRLLTSIAVNELQMQNATRSLLVISRHNLFTLLELPLYISR